MNINEMNTEELKFLKLLKPGDKVIIKSSTGGFSHSFNVGFVKKITPKGRIRIENGNLFKDGICRVGDYFYQYLLEYKDGEVIRLRKEENKKWEENSWIYGSKKKEEKIHEKKIEEKII